MNFVSMQELWKRKPLALTFWRAERLHLSNKLVDRMGWQPGTKLQMQVNQPKKLLRLVKVTDDAVGDDIVCAKAMRGTDQQTIGGNIPLIVYCPQQLRHLDLGIPKPEQCSKRCEQVEVIEEKKIIQFSYDLSRMK